MKTYKRPRKRTRASRTRQVLDQMDGATQREWMAVTMQSSERAARTRIQERYPHDTPEEIERRVAFVMKKGAKPTTAKVLEPGVIPAEVLEARKAERKRQVKENRPQRQREEKARRANRALRANASDLEGSGRDRT
jgi:hypothetical protein